MSAKFSNLEVGTQRTLFTVHAGTNLEATITCTYDFPASASTTEQNPYF